MEPDNRFSMQKLEVFCKVVSLGGVRKAAEELYISQPVVSAHLRSLEDRLGAKLFRKDGRGLQLTEAGEAVHYWAHEVLRGRVELAKNLADLSGGTAGTVSVAASMSAGNSLVTPAVIDFRKQHRDASITLTMSSVEVALDAARAGRADFCVVATDEVLDAKSFEAELVGQPSFALLVSPANTEVPDPVTAADLAKLPFITPPDGLAIRRSQEAALARLGVRNRHVEIELGSAESIKQAVTADLGVALLWRSSAERELRTGELREVKIAGPPIRDKVYVVQRAGKQLSPLQRRLRAAIKSRVTSILGEGSR